MNRKKLESRVNVCAAKILNEKGYVSPIDLLLEMDRITPKQVEEWRLKKIRVTIGNLSKMQTILKALRRFATERNLKPSILFISHGEKEGNIPSFF